MKVKELRKLLAGRGLSKSGRKDDLVARLVEADAAGGGSVADDAPAGAASGDGKGSKTGGSASVADSAPMDTSASVVNEVTLILRGFTLSWCEGTCRSVVAANGRTAVPTGSRSLRYARSSWS